MNSRRGSDVPEDGESSGVARLSFSRLDFESPTRIEQEEREGGSNGWKKRGRNPRSGRGLFIAQSELSVVPTWGRYYQGSR
jgi:hypothetical protein